MFNWWPLAFEASHLALEVQEVVSMRLTKIGRGDAAATLEVQKMVVEKMMVANEAWMAAAGAMLSQASPQGVASAFLRHRPTASPPPVLT